MPSATTPAPEAPTTRGAAPLLAVEDLHAGYLGIPAVRHLTLTVAAGEVVALLGPNGAGKTTTLSTIAGLLPPISGTVTLAGEAITGRAAYKLARLGISLVPEDRALFYELTVRENLRLARGERSLPQEELLSMLPELEKCLGRKAGVLSGGEQQMLAVGRALISRPRLLLVDEMSLGLAPVVVERLLPILRRIANDLGAGVMFVEQHISMALELADRAYVLNHGEIVLAGNAADLRGNRELVEASYLGEATMDELSGESPTAAG
jgi:branched-chain amino acid transport system ATP-binding protein